MNVPLLPKDALSPSELDDVIAACDRFEARRLTTSIEPLRTTCSSGCRPSNNDRVAPPVAKHARHAGHPCIEPAEIDLRAEHTGLPAVICPAGPRVSPVGQWHSARRLVVRGSRFPPGDGPRLREESS